MRKPKRGPSLFDVLQHNEPRSAAVPDRPAMAGAVAEPVARGKAASMDHRSRAGTASADRPVPMDSVRCTESGNESAVAAEPVVQVVGDRVHLSLSSFSMAIAVFGLLVFVFAAFDIGRRFGDGGGFRRGHAAGRASYIADAMSDIEIARSQPPAMDIVESLRTERLGGGSVSESGGPLPAAGSSEGEREASGTTWIRGYTYVVAQEFGVGREDDARRAQAFLAEHGVGTEIVRYRNGTSQLITTQGFNRRDSTQSRLADGLLERVHALGARYMAAGGGYRLEGYFKLLTGSTW